MQHFFEQLQTVPFWVEGIAPLVLVLVTYYVLLLILTKLCRKGRNGWLQTWRNLGWFVYIVALYQPLVFFIPELSQSLWSFGKIFTSPLFGTESGPSLISLSLLIPIFFVSSRLTTGLVRLLEIHFDRNSVLQKRIYKSNVRALLTISHYVLLLLFCLFGISLVGINLSSLGVILGALGLGIGLGLQNMAANFVSGITLLLSGHIQPGDFVRTPKAFGTVERIGLMSTIVLTTEYENLIIPNQYLLNEIIENASYDNNRMVQLHLPLGVSYESDLDLVTELLQQILERNPYRPWAPEGEAAKQIVEMELPFYTKGNTDTKSNGAANIQESDVWLKGFGSSAIDFEVRLMIENIDVYRAATHWFYMEVWRVFKQQDVVIPFAQMDVHIYNEEGQKVRSVTGFG